MWALTLSCWENPPWWSFGSSSVKWGENSDCHVTSLLDGKRNRWVISKARHLETTPQRNHAILRVLETVRQAWHHSGRAAKKGKTAQLPEPKWPTPQGAGSGQAVSGFAPKKIILVFSHHQTPAHITLNFSSLVLPQALWSLALPNRGSSF